MQLLRQVPQHQSRFLLSHLLLVYGSRIRADRLAGRGEILLVNVVTDAVAWAGEVCAVRAGGRPQEMVVVSILKIELKGLVVTVYPRKFSLELLQSQCFELEECKHPRCILCENLIYTYLLTRF